MLLLLRRHAIRPTPVRLGVLAVLCQSPFALSGAEIEPQLTQLLGRVTLYRTLQTFEQKGLIHRVVDHSETVRYALCSHAPATGPIDYVHFKCVACQRFYCLTQVVVPTLILPGVYQVVRGDYLLSGVCEQCQLE
jgi:Fur family ferric uptake transcriptional regulator